MQQEPLLLGLIDAKITEEVNWTVNKVGGLPDWLFPSPAPRCQLCSAPMSLVCQLYCPLGGSDYHRVLHVFACTHKQCWNKQGSWTVLRSQLKDQSYSGTLANQKNCNIASGGDWNVTSSLIGSSDLPQQDEWGLDPDDWGDETTVAMDTISMVTAQFEDITLQSKTLSQQEKNCDPCATSEVSVEKVNYKEALLRNDGASEEDCVGSCDTFESENGGNLTSGDSVVIADDSDLNLLAKRPDVLAANVSPPGNGLQRDEVCHEGINRVEGLPGSALPVVFESHYVNVVEAPICTKPSLTHEEALLKQYARQEGVHLSNLMDVGSGPTQGMEKYEKTEVKHGDKIFHKFLKGVSGCPEQMLRYQYNGAPLYISSPTHLPPVPACELCGQARLFELQLMPGLVPFLTMTEIPGIFLEFGSVYIYTCAKSCWSEGEDTVKSEYVLLQPDPDSTLFKV